jgi:hypothetical protein
VCFVNEWRRDVAGFLIRQGMMMVDLRRFFKLLNVAFTMLLLACTMPEKVNDNVQLQQGTAAYETGDYNEAFRLLQPLAEQGNAQAQSILGWLYENGEGVTQDDKQALEWYQKAANQGFAEAQYNLGNMYHDKDNEQAVFWYKKAAQQGDIGAQFTLGWMYDTGLGVTRDEKQAVMWYQKAANQGHAMSQYNLGWMYHQGRGTAIAQNFQQAKAWYQKVLAQPDTEENDEAKALARENLQKLESMGIR